jgi:hypothetical protein
MQSPHRHAIFVFVMRQSYHRLGKPLSVTTKTTRLALEVQEAIASDSLCGPASDRARHFIGIEYEIVLERGLKNLGRFIGICFCNYEFAAVLSSVLR